MSFKPTFIQMVRVPIKGRVEVMSITEAQKLIQELSNLLTMNQPKSLAIKLKVCHEFNLRSDEIMSDRRPERIVFPRQVAMWLHRNLTDLSLEDIGRAFARKNGKPRDHGTVHHACRLVESRMATDKQICSRVMGIHASLINESK